MPELDAIVLAEDPLSRVRIAGLSVRERCVRVARRVGATRVIVVDDRAQLAGITSERVLVIRADQLVHTPLVAALVTASAPLAIAVEDSTYAGALLATGGAASEIIARLAAGASDSEVVATFGGATQIPAGAIARHAIGTPDERRGAHRLLYKILVKPQDNAITRYLYRPVSFPLTRLLAWTPITPNQISYLVGLIVILGCWLTAHESFGMATAGTCTVLGASYLDCCDGEIARVKLTSSRYGAWIDTIIDELSSVGYMAALGYHCYLHFGPTYLGNLGFDPWLAAIAIGVVTYAASIYGVYYNIIVAVGSANSQDYAGRFDVVPGAAPNSVKLKPTIKAIATQKPLPPWLEFFATYLPYMVRRDFISWGATILAFAHLTQVSFAIQIAGGVVAGVIVTVDHIKLRRLRSAIVRRGQVIESPG